MTKKISLNSRVFLSLFAVIAVFLTLYWGTERLISHKVSQQQQHIQTKIEEILQIPVRVGSIEFHWHYLQPVLILNDVTLFDKQQQFPLTIVDELEIYLKYLPLFKRQVQPSALNISGLRMTLDIKEDLSLEIYGLEKNKVSSLNTAPLTTLLRSISKVDIEHADIHIQGEHYDLPFAQTSIKFRAKGQQKYELETNTMVAALKPTFFNAKFKITGPIEDLSSADVRYKLSAWGVDVKEWLKIFKLEEKVKLTGKSQFDVSGILKNGHPERLSLDARIQKGYFKTSLQDTSTAFNEWHLAYQLIPSSLRDHYQFQAEHVFKQDKLTQNNKFRIDFTKSFDHVRFSGQKVSLNDPAYFLILEAMDDISPEMQSQIQQYLPQGEIIQSLIDYYPNHKQANIGFSKANLHLDGMNVFPNNLYIQLLDSDILLDWQKTFSLSTKAFKFKTPLTEGQVTLTLNIPSQGSPVLDMAAKIGPLDVVTGLQAYLPRKVLNQNLLDWLDLAFSQGKISQGEFALKGVLDEFPFTNTEGQYQWQLAFHDLDLNYDSQWPELKKANGRVMVDKTQYKIEVDSGLLFDLPVENLQADINPVGIEEQDALLIFKGKMSTHFAKAINFLKQSPLVETAHILEKNRTAGDFELDLMLNIPLNDEPNTVMGKIKTNNASMQPTSIFTLKDINGNIHFTENSLHADDLILKANEQQATAIVVAGEQQHPTDFAVIINTVIDPSSYDLPSPIQKRLSGQSPLIIKYNTNWQPKGMPYQKVELSSDLKGITSAIPYPLNKDAEASKQSNLTIDLLNQIANFSYADTVHSSFAYQFNPNFTVKGGHIILGDMIQTGIHALQQEQMNRFDIQGYLAYLDWPLWQELMDINPGQELAKANIDVIVGVLPLLSDKISNVRLQYNSQDDSERIILGGDNASGVVVVPSDPKASININLARLNLELLALPSEQKEHHTNSESVLDIYQDDEVNIRAVNFRCQNLTYHGHPYEQLDFDMNYDQNKLNFRNIRNQHKAYLMVGEGEVNLKNQATDTHIKGTLVSQNLGKMLEAWGIESAIRKGAGDIEFELTFPGLPEELQFEATSGFLNFDFTNGRMTGVEPGLGRIMGLLSLDNISRRMKLDFSDIFQKGLAFDELKGKLIFKSGEVEPHEIKLEGPAAEITLSGTMDLKGKSIQYYMKVVPKVSSSIPIAAAIAAGNPAVGAAFWMLDQTVGTSIKKLASYYYQVTGTWEKPEIKELDSATAKAAIKDLNL